MIRKRSLVSILLASVFLAGCAISSIGNDSSSSKKTRPSSSTPAQEEENLDPVIHFDFDEHNGSYIENIVDHSPFLIDNLFNEENASKIFKAPADPLFKAGVGGSGKSLYVDGHSTNMNLRGASMPGNKLTISMWVAPRGFENLINYGWDTAGHDQPRLTALLNRGNVEYGEGYLFGYGRLGKWGIQMNLHSNTTGQDQMYSFYDPLNVLELYQWNHIAVSYDGETGYVGLFYNGERAFEGIYPDLIDSEIIYSSEPTYLGHYCDPMYEYGCTRQRPAGLIDDFYYYERALSPKEIHETYQKGCVNNVHPSLDFDEVKEDRDQYEGDRYRPVFHGIPPATWMNEPHSPIYYKGMYHIFYQHDPIGPYWSQIRWGHWASPDMIHWTACKDPVVPTPGICPEGVWTGGSVIGPDGTPWLIITAGTNQSTWTGQNIAYAHCVDPDDPYLNDWVVEDKVVLTQPDGDVMGEREQFRDPFVWYDDGLYYMLVSTSIPGRGGSANVYTSPNMREWQYHGYLYDCPWDVNLQGDHWECVNMLPISTKDGSIKRWILFDCPQYINQRTVDCLYWIGTFDKKTCRFTPDNKDHEPKLFDFGNGFYTGQTGFCYLTEKDKANGKTRYEDGRTVLFALAQGKSAGTQQNIDAGWAHNLAMPVNLYLAEDGKTVIREVIPELESAVDSTLFEYDGDALTADRMNALIDNVHSDTFWMDMKLHFEGDSYDGGLFVRYNKHVINTDTERTAITFNQENIHIDRSQSTLLSYVDRYDSYYYGTHDRDYDVSILFDRSLMEVYINNKTTFTVRSYPKYGNSDYFHFFDNSKDAQGNAVTKMTVSDVRIRQMKSVYYETTTPAYYGNTGNFGED